MATRRDAGQALVEFAVVLPLLLVLLLGMIDLGRVVWAHDTAANAAREGARYASVRGDSSLTPDASKQQIRDHVNGWLLGSAAAPAVTVCYSQVRIAQEIAGCSGNSDEPGATNARGALVTVSVTTSVGLVASGLLGLGDFSVTASSTMLVSN
ncbi:MAG TPA: TadE family protein [Candidatus Limnocylindria bacterium]|jgi:Flp pilus assembly protein TadG|nr:TadE family protein [Candidatus Limnocylindria bacterium]